LAGVDLEVRRGEIFALVGPDGAGKTTCIRTLCGILTPDGGSAEVLGWDVVHSPEEVKVRIGYMPQRFSLYGDLSVHENLAFYAGIYQVPAAQFHERAAQLLRDFQLGDATDRPAQFLSGGMKQKLALACTLIHTPELILLDEPTTGVDPVSRRQFWRILYSLNRTGITIFVSTPYLDEAERASRVGLMDHGQIIACDDPGALKATMQGDLLEIVAEPRATARAILRDLPLIRSLEVFGDRLHALVPSAEVALPQVHEALATRGVQVLGARRIVPSLEDVFVSRISTQSGG
jgi:ABC-2 type transport system ATP-binding protein